MMLSVYLFFMLFIFFLSFDEMVAMTLLFATIVGLGLKDLIEYNWLTKIVTNLYFEFDFYNLVNLFNFNLE